MKTLARILLPILFFISGFAGLTYEVVWSRYLSLIIGNTTQSHRVVLFVFLGGLAIGNFCFGKWSDHYKNPVVSYGFMELGIAVWCALYPAMHRLFYELNLGITGFAAGYPAELLFHGFLAVLGLGVPTFLMGGTFPVMVKALSSRISGTRTISQLYAVNSFGAVVGSLAASLVLIRILGLDRAIMAGAFLSGIAGLGALALSPHFSSTETNREEEPPEISRFEEPPNSRQALGMYGLVFFSGFSALALELAWFRFFALILGSTLFSFSLMLSAFILGITLGSLFAMRLAKGDLSSARLVLYAGLCQAAFSITLLASFLVYPRLPYVFIQTAVALGHSEKNFWIYQAFTFIFCFVLMLAPTFFSGMSLPLASGWIAHYEKKLGEGAGRAFGLNLCGTLLGSLAAGLLFLPFFGIRGTLLASGAVSFIVGCSVLYLQPQVSMRFKTAGILVFLILMVVNLFSADWKWPLLSAQSFVIGAQMPPKSYTEFKQNLKNSKLLFYKDGSQSTVAVLEHASGDRVLKIDGKTDASAFGDLPTELLLGHIPMLLRSERLEREQTKTLCVGFGSGITAGAILRYPKTELDLVEISPEVIGAAPFFSEHNYDILSNPSCNLFIDDAKSFLIRTQARYDLIVSEPSNPRLPGIANLFTREFFELAKSRLQKDGLMAQWFHLYAMNDETVRVILRTFQAVFPHVQVWSPQFNDIVMVGSNQAINLQFDLISRRLSFPPVKKDLERVHVYDMPTLLILEMISTPLLEWVVGEGSLHTDFFPRLEFDTAKSVFTRTQSTFLNRADQRRTGMEGLILKRYRSEKKILPREYEFMAHYLQGYHRILIDPRKLKELTAQAGTE